jgi:hypothetical protein
MAAGDGDLGPRINAWRRDRETFLFARGYSNVGDPSRSPGEFESRWLGVEGSAARVLGAQRGKMVTRGWRGDK